MTNVIVTPIDLAAKGSRKRYSRTMRALSMLRKAQDSNDMLLMADAYVSVEDVIIAQCVTDDGSPLEDALDEMSQNEFLSLLSAISEGSVPPANGSPASVQPEGKASLPSGSPSS